jgi:hypothetical protein
VQNNVKEFCFFRIFYFGSSRGHIC